MLNFCDIDAPQDKYFCESLIRRAEVDFGEQDRKVRASLCACEEMGENAWIFRYLETPRNSKGQYSRI